MAVVVSRPELQEGVAYAPVTPMTEPFLTRREICLFAVGLVMGFLSGIGYVLALVLSRTTS